MVITASPPQPEPPRDDPEVAELIAGITAGDALEAEQLADSLDWIAGGAPLYRAAGAPDRHLVSYFVVTDPATGRLLLGAHRKAGLWLPTGGHVEPGEHPWRTVVRECREELRLTARPTERFGDRPLFFTVTDTRGARPHTDVSLWFVLETGADRIDWFDPAEFDRIEWFGTAEVLATPIDTLDPHLHRFTRKLLATGWPAGPSRTTAAAR